MHIKLKAALAVVVVATADIAHAIRKATTTEAHVSFGGNARVPNAAWADVQDTVDCLARDGAWTPKSSSSPPLPVRQALFSDSRCPWRHPYDRKEHPAFWYTWSEHEGCYLAPWSRAAFCKALRNRTLLIVGDSMNYILHDSFLSALLDRVAVEDDHGQWKPCNGHVICVREAAATAHLPDDHADKVMQSIVRFVRNDKLSTIRKDARVIERAWLPFVTDNTLLILNRGAHYVGDRVLVRQVQHTMARIEAMAPGAGIIWRSTVRGHEEGRLATRGEEARAINAALLPLREAPSYGTNRYARRFHWDRFRHQNRLVEHLVNDLTLRWRPPAMRVAARIPGVIFLDVDNSTALRADHHRDGLHYCIPGPVDHWLPLVQGVLEAVGRLETHN